MAEIRAARHNHPARTGKHFNEGEDAQAGIENGVFTIRISGRAVSHRNWQGTQYVKLYLPAAEYDRIELHSSNAAIYINGEKRGKSCSAGYGTRKVVLDTSNGRINVTYKPALLKDTQA